MHNNTTIALLLVLGGLSSFTAFNKVMVKRPVALSVVAIPAVVGVLLVYVGLFSPTTLIIP